MEEARQRRIALGILIAAMALSALAILYWSRGASFYADDWTYIVDRRAWSPHTLFLPETGHLIVLPLIVFKTLLAIFGATSALPFRLAVVLFDLLNGLLLYLLVRRRVGPLLALAPAVLLLFLGAGWEEIFEAFTLDALISIAAGLGMMLCLDRRDLRGDIGACLLLVVSLASFSLGIVFGLLATVELLQRPRYGLRRAWVYLGPALLYGIWLIWASQYHENQLAATNIGPGPAAIVNGASAAAAAIFGVFRSPGAQSAAAPDLGIAFGIGTPIALALGALLVWRLISGPKPSPRTWALLAALLALWSLLALTISPARLPQASRYVYPGVVLVLLLAAELCAGIRLTRGIGIGVAAVLAVSLVANVDEMRVAGGYFRAETSYNRAELAALELVRDRVPADFGIEGQSPTLLPHGDMLIAAGPYFSAADKYGSPAYSPSQLAAAGPAQRAAADELLGRGLAIAAVPASRFGKAGPGVVRPGSAALNMTVERRGRCVFMRPTPGYRGRAALQLPRGGFRFSVDPTTEAQVSLGRFGDGFAIKPSPVMGSATVAIPPDRSPRPWRALIESPTPVIACPA
jgi:hypothetical protein